MEVAAVGTDLQTVVLGPLLPSCECPTHSVPSSFSAFFLSPPMEECSTISRVTDEIDWPRGFLSFVAVANS
jgi:hypothetical protein